ncbi:MAG: CotH kinase family protein [Chloroflexota bacterium]
MAIGLQCRPLMSLLIRSPWQRHLWLALTAVLLAILLTLIVPRHAPADSLPETAVRFSIPSGYVGESQQLVLETAVSNATILFTTDGTTPTPNNGHRYSNPIFLDAAVPNVTVIRARVETADATLHPITDASYIIGIANPLPIVSLVVEPTHLWDETTGIYQHPEEQGIEWERPISLTYVGVERETAVSIPAGLRIHGQFSRSYAKKSFRLYFRQEYGASRLEQPMFPDSLRTSFKRLVLHASGQDSSQLPTNWTLIRNQLVARLAQQTNALATHSQPALLFINGEPWGHYYLREHINGTLLQEGYGAETADLVDTPARREENPADITPAYADWDQLTGFIASRDLADDANYRFVATQVDLDSFIDYTILQIYSANFDWPFTNMKQFRTTTQGGRWQWILWDSDLSLGLKPWSDVGQNTLEQALDPTYTAAVDINTNGNDTILLRGLLQNEAFRMRFLTRADELLNTVLAPEPVIAEIDRLAAEIEPAIGMENGRWQGDTAAWHNHIVQLRDFAQQRPAIMRQHLNETLR